MSELQIRDRSERDLRSCEVTNKAQKKFWGSNRIQTHDLCDTSVMLYQLRYEASPEVTSQLQRSLSLLCFEFPEAPSKCPTFHELKLIPWIKLMRSLTFGAAQSNFSPGAARNLGFRVTLIQMSISSRANPNAQIVVIYFMFLQVFPEVDVVNRTVLLLCWSYWN